LVNFIAKENQKFLILIIKLKIMGAKCCSSISNLKKFANIKLRLIELMEKAYKAEEYKSALVTAKEILKKDPNNHYVVFYKALILKQTKNFKKAKKTCLNFLSKYRYPRIEFLLLKIYKMQMKYDKALKFLDEKVLLDNNNAINFLKAFLKKAKIFMEIKDYYQAFLIVESFLNNFGFFKERNKEFVQEEKKLMLIFFNTLESMHKHL
jgi:tetratricopeptide (TPR) repeat protein